MDAWLESLSEDWVSQPGSSPSDSRLNELSGLEAQLSCKIPRRSSGTYPSVGSTTESAPLRTGKRRPALIERSESEINTLLRSSPAHVDSKRGRPQQQSGSLVSRDSEQPIVEAGTLDRKCISPSPPKSRKTLDTPEWKRRILKGQSGFGDQRDLFSPSDLEHLFKQPTLPRRSSPQKSVGIQYLSLEPDCLPSSPPQWPSNQSQNTHSSTLPSAKETASAAHRVTLGSLKEQEESLAGRGGENNDKQESAVQGTGEDCGSLQRLGTDHCEAANEGAKSTTMSSATQEAEANVNPEINRRNTGQVLSQKLTSKAASGNCGPEKGQRKSCHDNDNVTVRIETPDIGLTLTVANKVLGDGEGNIPVSALAEEQVSSLDLELELGMREHWIWDGKSLELPDIGPFVDIKRGGYSAAGSFRQRALSPSSPQTPLACSTAIEPSLQQDDDQIGPHADAGSAASKILQPQQIEHATPRTPSRAEKTFLSPQNSRCSRSPLKLFGDHDTFTNNRLLRRISQLQDAPGEEQHDVLEQAQMRYSEERGVTLQGDPRVVINPAVSLRRSSKITLPEAESGSSDQRALDAQLLKHEVGAGSSRSRNALPAKPRHLQSKENSVMQRRVPSTKEDFPQPHGQGNATLDSFPGFVNIAHSGAPKIKKRIPSVLEGKRPPTSPFKYSTPKRRRTSHIGVHGTRSLLREDSVKEHHHLMQAVIGRVPSGSAESNAHGAQAELLEFKGVPRPRNPTPNTGLRQHNLSHHIIGSAYSGQAFAEMEAVIEDIENTEVAGDPSDAQQTLQIAEEVAAFSISLAKMQNSDRKRSVNTQDYLDEAMRIMHMIRNKGRPPSALDGVEEDFSGSISRDDDLSSTTSSMLLSSRTATRQGALIGWTDDHRRPVPDPTSTYRMRFENSDEDKMVKALEAVTLDDKSSLPPQARAHHYPQENMSYSRAPTIRIIEQRATLHKRKHSTSSMSDEDPQTIDTQQTSYKSQESSTGRTFSTNKSQQSDNVQRIAPDAVGHLIPTEVAGMSFDRDKQTWIKTKRIAPETASHSDVGLHSDEDPLGRIPDLSVDEDREHDRAASNEVRRQLPEDFNATSSKPRSEPFVGFVNQQVQKLNNERHQHTSNMKTHQVDDTPAPSKTGLVSLSAHLQAISQTDKTETATTPRRFDEPPSGIFAAKAFQKEVVRDTEQETGRLNGIAKDLPNGHRKVTVTFSSPLLQRDQPSRRNEPQIVTGRHDPSELDIEDEDQDDSSSVVTVVASHQSTPLRLNASRGHNKPARWLSVSTQPFRTRSMTSINEQRAAHFHASLQQTRATSLALSVLTPLTLRSILPPSALNRRRDLTFQLTPLSEFTLNQSDEVRCIELSYIGDARNKSAGTSRKTSGSFAAQRMVQTLMDVQPEDFFWEETRKLDLANQGLTTLHTLDEFCPRTEELNVSGNELTQLLGAPPGVRTLVGRANLLSGLTHWEPFTNLQYLDLSGNKIESLEGFEDLIHLRELLADDNAIDSLDGILHLDGLLKLSLSRNHLEEVDFSGSNLKRLVDLNLEANALVEVHNLQCLPELSTLNLDNNHVTLFPADDPELVPMRKMRILKLRNNKIDLLVMNFFPLVETLLVDRNELDQILGIENLKNLETLYMREQKPSPTTCKQNDGSLDQFSEVRSLYLSANPYQSIKLSAALFALQRLELASAGLHILPRNFGRLIPNVRRLNLSSNAIEKLQPLLGMNRLKRLLVTGNRITRLRQTGKVLGHFPELTHVDLRENPLTVGFYSSRTSANPGITDFPTIDEGEEEDESDEGAYTLPRADPILDRSYWATLDENTKLKRRVYETLLGSNCRNLKILDGLGFDDGSAMANDEIWERLLELGYVRRAAIQ